MVKTKNKVDPFAGIENADRLSDEERKKLLDEAMAGMEVVELDTSPIIILMNDFLTFIIMAAAGYLLMLLVLEKLTASLL